LYSRDLDARRDYTEDELVRTYAARPLDFVPGTKWSYSNTGYQVLGFLIRRVTGQTYDAFLHDRIFQPLGMTATRASSWSDIIPNRVTGYESVQGRLQLVGWAPPSLLFGADGGLVSTVEDMARWGAALYTEFPLTRAQREVLWTPAPVTVGTKWPYGMAWEINDANGHRLIWHTGGGFGFYDCLSRYVNDSLTIIVLTNLGEAHSDVLKIAGRIGSLYLPDTKGANLVKDW
jgi:CubicO group peptidase (beta-lactamase class C family)